MPLEPSDAPACAAALREAAGAGRTLRVRGGGTKDGLGELLPTDEVLLTTSLRGVVDHVPADLTCTVRAGTRIAELRSALAAQGQFLPLDPPHAGATVGGVIAANSNGFGTLRYGAVRNLLIGTTTALADGTIARAGGRVVKNVAGYDLNKLLVGSFGTLGVIVEATFKVLPLPAARGGSVRRVGGAAEGFALADGIIRRSLRPTALLVERHGREWRLIVAAAGEQAVVDRTVREAGGDAVADPETVVGPLRELPATAHDGALIRVVLPLAAQAAFADSAVRLDGVDHLVADAGSGAALVHVRADDATVAATAAACMASAHVLGGIARAERRAPGVLARVAPHGGERPPGHFLMRRVKDLFDPRGILEPGRSIV